MKITKDEVIHVANLARLEIEEGEVDKFASQISRILDYVATLDRVDTENIPLTSHASFATNAFREDEVKDSLGMEKSLANAPMKEDGYFIVPKVIA